MNVEEGENALRHKIDKRQKSKSCRMEKTDSENAKSKKKRLLCVFVVSVGRYVKACTS